MTRRATAPVSVLLLCWNHARFLESCIASVAAQEEEVEIVFLDNASTDGSYKLAGELFDRFGLRATMLRNQQPASIPVNFNALLAASSAPLVSMLSTDDWYEPGYVGALREAAAADPDAGWFSCGGWLYFDAEHRSEPVDEARFVTAPPVGEVILDGKEPHFFVGCAYRRTALEAVGGWDEDQLIEDRDLFLRLSQRFTHHRIARRLVHYRRGSMTASANAGFMVEGWERFLAKHSALFGKALVERRAEMYRSYAALAVDGGELRRARGLIGKALRLRPAKFDSWRTLFYLVRSAVRRRGQP